MHRRWLAGLRFEQAAHHIVLEDCIAAVEAATARRARLEAHIEAALADWSLAPVVRALQALRGMALVAAATLVAELGDVARFANPRQLMAYLGLVPSEHSSGATRRQGGITKAGNGAGAANAGRGRLELSVPGARQSRATAATGRLGQADPGHRLESAGTAVSTISQAGSGGKIADRYHHGNRSRTVGFRLGDHTTGAGRRRLMR
jgi:hypothetical protein